MNYCSALLCSFILATTVTAHAIQYDFLSHYDHFAVDVTHGRATFNGQHVSGKPFIYIEPLFRAELEANCDKTKLPAQPDLTIIRKADKNAAIPFDTRRLVYFDKRLISDGQHCATVTGQEFYLLPLHRKWFTNLHETKSIHLGGSFAILVHGRTLVAFTKDTNAHTANHWQTKKFTPNWSYVANFVSALHDFTVDFRAHPAAALPKTKFILKTAQQRYVFEKVGTTTWAVRMPGSSWLIASGDFGIFGKKMNLSKWVSPYESSLRIIQDDRASTVTRIAALKSLTEDTLASIRPTLAQILSRTSQPLELREEIVQRLRESPSMANMQVLIHALSASEKPQFLNVVTETLRIRNPHGPVIEPDDDASAIRAKIAEWRKWVNASKVRTRL